MATPLPPQLTLHEYDDKKQPLVKYNLFMTATSRRPAHFSWKSVRVAKCTVLGTCALCLAIGQCTLLSIKAKISFFSTAGPYG